MRLADGKICPGEMYGLRSARAASRGLPATRAVTPTLEGACVSVDNESGEAEICFEVPRLGKAEGRQPALSGPGKEDRYESQALLLALAL